jgi:rSAM/selenodomain-associated transferase 1
MSDAILMFCRWPEPGTTKTRLIPALGAEGAAIFYRGLAERVAAVVRRVTQRSQAPYAYFTPADRADDIAAWLGSDFAPLPQPDGDLGDRLVHGFNHAFAAGAERVVAIGTDCVEITPDHLRDALDRLRDHDAVVGPATDGGYWVIGLARPMPEAFADVPWSTDRTCAVTLERLAAAGPKLAILPTLSDVDRPADLPA